jgi:hypothetical protein
MPEDDPAPIKAGAPNGTSRFADLYDRAVESLLDVPVTDEWVDTEEGRTHLPGSLLPRWSSLLASGQRSGLGTWPRSSRGRTIRARWPRSAHRRWRSPPNTTRSSRARGPASGSHGRSRRSRTASYSPANGTSSPRRARIGRRSGSGGFSLNTGLIRSDRFLDPSVSLSGLPRRLTTSLLSNRSITYVRCNHQIRQLHPTTSATRWELPNR